MIALAFLLAGLAQVTGGPGADELFARGMALAKGSHYSEAAEIFSKAAAQFPADKRFPIELAGISYRQSNAAAARGYLRRALALDPGDRYAVDFLGTIYLLDGNIPAALQAWNPIGKPLLASVRVIPRPPVDAVLLDRSIAVSAGQVLTLRRWYDMLRDLHRAELLPDARFELAPADGERFDLTIRASPAKLPVRGWLGTALPLLRGLPYETIYWGDSLVRWDSNKRRVELGAGRAIHSNPRLVGRVFADARDEHWILSSQAANMAPNVDFRMRTVKAGGDFNVALGDRLEWTVGAALGWRGFRDANLPGGLSVEQWNRFDYPLLRLPAHRLEVSSAGVLRTGRFFRHSTYASLEADVATTWYPQAAGERWRFSSRLRGARSFGKLPFDELFQLGMERDNDLWLRGHLGARGGPKGSAPLGSNYVLSQTQFDRELVHLPLLGISAGPFLDAGRITGAFGGGQWLPDAGLEAQVKTVGRVTVRLVYGRDLRGGRGAFYTAIERR